MAISGCDYCMVEYIRYAMMFLVNPDDGRIPLDLRRDWGRDAEYNRRRYRILNSKLRLIKDGKDRDKK